MKVTKTINMYNIQSNRLIKRRIRTDTEKLYDLLKYIIPGHLHSWFYIFHSSVAETASEAISVDGLRNLVVFLTMNCSYPHCLVDVDADQSHFCRKAFLETYNSISSLFQLQANNEPSSRSSRMLPPHMHNEQFTETEQDNLHSCLVGFYLPDYAFSHPHHYHYHYHYHPPA